MIADGQASADRIEWSRSLRSRFAEYFEVVRSRDDQVTPQNPFRYLQSDGIWRPVENIEGHPPVPLQREPLVGECDTGRISAAFAGGFEDYVLTPTNRTRLREALVARYFPDARVRVEALFRDVVRVDRVAEAAPAEQADACERTGRKRGFVKTEKDDPRGPRHTVHGTAADGTTPVGSAGRFTGTSRYLIITAYEVSEE